MKKTRLTICLIIALVSIAAAGHAEFYVIPVGGPRVGTVVSKLPFTITESGLYYLSKSLQTTGNGITVEADNVTILLNGCTISGDGVGSGIYMNGRSNVTVANGTLQGFENGIFEESSSGKNHRAIGIRAISNTRGVRLQGSHHIVRNCTVEGNNTGTGNGITVSSNSRVTGNISYNNANYGIYAYYGSILSENTVYQNGDNGIHVYRSILKHNVAYENGGHGIFAYTNCTVIGNNASKNTNIGVYTYSGATVTQNTANDNDNHGFYCHDGCMYSKNTAYGNANKGFSFFNSSWYSLAHSNTAYGNGTNMDATCYSCTKESNYAP
jgi:parallel beta-helix repeat protein